MNDFPTKVSTFAACLIIALYTLYSFGYAQLGVEDNYIVLFVFFSLYNWINTATRAYRFEYIPFSGLVGDNLCIIHKQYRRPYDFYLGSFYCFR